MLVMSSIFTTSCNDTNTCKENNDFADLKPKLEETLSFVISKIDQMLPTFTDKFPSHNSVNNVYQAEGNTGGWNTGFWTGILWHAYELTGDEKYKNVALGHIDSFENRIEKKINVNHHDMGFLYIPSCVAAYKLEGNTDARDAAIKAADQLASRYHEKGEFIQAWGSLGAESNYRLIVDCLMNIPLLFWATEVTGNPSYAEIAQKHFNTTASVAYREDGSTFHTYYFDKQTGEPLKGVTAQGVSDNSAWSRGQAWGAYGPLLTYKYTGDEKALEIFKETVNYFLNHLPKDNVPYWDLSFTSGDEPRDSSAAAILLCAMLEGIKYMDESDPLRQTYVEACKNIMSSLIDNYTTRSTPAANGILLHGTYSKPSGSGVDEMLIWGDYFFMEALHRMLCSDWNLYW